MNTIFTLLAEFTLSLPYGIYYTNSFLVLKETFDLVLFINQDIENHQGN